MDHVLIALITTNEDLARACTDKLANQTGFQLERLTSIEAFRAWAPGKRISAILVDLKTLIGAPISERTYLNSLVDALPVAKIRFDRVTGQVTANIQAEALIGDDFFNHLIQALNTSKSGRLIRRFPRKNKTLNVKLFHESLEGGRAPFLTNTLNASEGGVFVLCGKSFPKDSLLKAHIVELGENPPIELRVRWSIDWGLSSNHCAGFGAEFEAITDEQRRRLQELIGLSLDKAALDSLLEQLSGEQA